MHTAIRPRTGSAWLGAHVHADPVRGLIAVCIAHDVHHQLLDYKSHMVNGAARNAFFGEEITQGVIDAPDLPDIIGDRYAEHSHRASFVAVEEGVRHAVFPDVPPIHAGRVAFHGKAPLAVHRDQATGIPAAQFDKLVVDH